MTHDVTRGSTVAGIHLVCCLAAALLLALAVPALGVPAAAATGEGTDVLQGQDHEVVARGLANPRGLHADGDAVYVAESGAGGPEVRQFEWEGGVGVVCLGETGGVTRIDASGQTRIAALPSAGHALPTPEGPTCQGTGLAAEGPNDLTSIGSTLAVTMGNAGDQPIRDQVHPAFGTVLKLLPNGEHLEMADIVAYEQVHNPDGALVDSNPYGITSRGGRTYVADAAANAIFRIDGTQVSTVAVLHPFDPVPFELPSCLPGPIPGFPPPGTLIPPESVPTQVAVAPDGYLYVTTLPGFPYTPGSAKVFRVDPDTGEASVFAEGFSTLVGLDVGPDGAVYVAEMVDGHLFEVSVCDNIIPGRVMKITEEATKVLGHAPIAGGVAVAADGSVYVSVNSISPTDGEVWRFAGD